MPNCDICSSPQDDVRIGRGVLLLMARMGSCCEDCSDDLFLLLTENQGLTPKHALNMKPLGASESVTRATTNAQGVYWLIRST